ncbi:MAG: DUF6077 domain-containing protein [Clostridium sp.]|nr:DUF6077 domain-containing protein [Clostridium sp.]
MISGIVILLVFSVVCYAVGRMIQQLLHQQGKGAAHAFVTGSFTLLILFFLLQIAVVGLSLPFFVLQWGYLCACVVLFLNAVLIVRGGLWSAPVREVKAAAVERERMILWLLTALVFVLNVIAIEIDTPYFGNDMTVEQAATTLETRTLYRYHPATGAEFMFGMTPLAKCNALPQFYAVLCIYAGARAYPFICSLVPVWGLLLNVSACSVLAGALGLTGRTRRHMLLFYLFLVLFGSYDSGAYAFRLLHQGFSLQTVFLATGGMALLALPVSFVRKRMSVGKGGGADA